MLLATWNINGLRARFDYLAAWLQERQPDVVGLQELKVTDDLFPHDEIEALGYHAVNHGQKAWNGVAILSKEPGEERQRGLVGQEEFGARLLTAKVSGLEFATVYCPNGKSVSHGDYPRKLAWFDALAAFVEQNLAKQSPAVLCGDFNITPSALDSCNEPGLSGSIFHTVAERERYQRFVDWGLRDVFRERYPEEPGFSWWDYRGGAFHRGRGLRIDALLMTPPLADRVERVFVDRDWRKKKDGLTPSDHAPVVAELR